MVLSSGRVSSKFFRAPQQLPGSGLATEEGWRELGTLPDQKAACPTCSGQHIVRTAATLLSEIYFCLACGKAFTIKKAAPTSGSGA